MTFHQALAEKVMRCKTPFIISLNDTPEVRKLYKGCIFEEQVVSYRYYKEGKTHNTSTKHELLIMGPKQFWQKQLGQRKH